MFILGKHKFYKELGYETLEDMALSEHKISRMQLHKYISIYEKLEQELLKMFNNVKSTLHFEALSIEKLYILTRIEEDEKIEFWFEKLCNENLSVSELKKELNKNNLLPKKDKIQGNINYIKDFLKRLPESPTDEEKETLKNLIKKINEYLGER